MSSLSDDEDEDDDSSWAGSGSSWTVSVGSGAGAWDSGSSWLELGNVFDVLLVKRPLLSLGCEMVTVWVSRSLRGMLKAFKGN